MLLFLFILLSPFSFALAATPGLVTEQSPHYDLELLYHERGYEKGWEITKRRLKETPQDKDLYWHYIRFGYELGEAVSRTDPNMDKVAFYQDLVDHADAGLKLAPSDPHLFFAHGVALGRLGTTRGILSSLFTAKTIEQDWLNAVHSDIRYSSLGREEVLPCDLHQALGQFYRLVPDWWIVRLLAGTRGDLDKSLHHLQIADRCSADRIQVVKELGVTQLCIADKRNDEEIAEKGKVTLSRMLQLTPEVATDHMDMRHARMLLKQPELACEYSRDGQQELDKKKFENEQENKK